MDDGDLRLSLAIEEHIRRVLLLCGADRQAARGSVAESRGAG